GRRAVRAGRAPPRRALGGGGDRAPAPAAAGQSGGGRGGPAGAVARRGSGVGLPQHRPDPGPASAVAAARAAARAPRARFAPAARTAARARRLRRRHRHPAPAARHRQGHDLRHPRGRARHGQRGGLAARGAAPAQGAAVRAAAGRARALGAGGRRVPPDRARPGGHDPAARRRPPQLAGLPLMGALRTASLAGDLFAPPVLQLVEDAQGGARYWPSVVDPDTARRWFDALVEGADWRSLRRPMYDRVVDVPRLLASYAIDELPPHLPLAAIHEVVRRHVPAPFTSIGMNLYRDGNDSVAMHGDKLHLLGEGHPVAVFSLG